MKTSARIIMSLAKNEFRIGASARFHFMWLWGHKKSTVPCQKYGGSMVGM